MKKISIVIPALNEEKGIGPVLREIPICLMEEMGYETEILVIDNGSTDRTPHIAREHGATVIIQPIRGYGNAYKAGFANASGDIIATGDADLTYPFSILPFLLKKMEQEELEFVNTDRLTDLDKSVMSMSHQLGNSLLTKIIKLLFRWPFKDSQSGMWVFKREIWSKLNVRSSGMPFSQELKIEAYIEVFNVRRFPLLIVHGQEKKSCILFEMVLAISPTYLKNDSRWFLTLKKSKARSKRDLRVWNNQSHIPLWMSPNLKP
jgi:glycosyltransferase involved in cell wall biosynthesis